MYTAFTRYASGASPTPRWEETSQTHPFLILKLKKMGFGEYFPRVGLGDSPFAKQN